jgi:uncharacterized membrane protein
MAQRLWILFLTWVPPCVGIVSILTLTSWATSEPLHAPTMIGTGLAYWVADQWVAGAKQAIYDA